MSILLLRRSDGLTFLKMLTVAFSSFVNASKNTLRKIFENNSEKMTKTV